MATERQAPDAILAQTNLTGVVGDIQDDPDSPDANWLTASGNNVNTDVRTSFATPTGSPTVGADLQEFRAQVRQFDEGQGGTPTSRCELWENGSLVRAGSNTSVPDGGIVLSFPWDASELATADGSLVEVKVVGTKSGGSPGNRNTVEVGAVEWNVAFSAGTNVDAGVVAMLLPEQAATLKADISLTAAVASLGLTEFIPTLATDISFTAGVDSIILTAQAAEVKPGVIINALTKALMLTVPNATVLTDVSLTASLAALTVVTQQTTVTLGIQINAASVAVAISPQSASLNIQMAVAAALQSISLSGLSASLNIAKLIASQAASIGLTPRNATVQEGGMAGGVAWMMRWDEEGRGSWWAG